MLKKLTTLLVWFVVWFASLWGMPAFSQSVATYIHPRATVLLPLVAQEAVAHAPEISQRHYFAGLIEHESCISLKHSRCWSPTSELKTHREQGLGLAQLTRAWGKTGSLRFDTLADLRRQYPNQLGQLHWDTLKNRPDLQIRAMVILTRQNYRQLSTVSDKTERLKMADSAYNGGLQNIHRSRSVCGLAKNCNPQIWFNHTERYNQKSSKILYDVRSARSINNHHVRDVFENRMPKFKPYFSENKS